MSNHDLDQDELNKEMILELFYSTKGNIDQINAAIDEKLRDDRTRSITLLESFIKTRIERNPKVLKMANMEITPMEAVYLSHYPALDKVEVLDLRQNFIGDVGMEAIANSEVLKNLRELDLRNNQISRVGMKCLAASSMLKRLEKVDMRLNKLGKRWEDKLKASPSFPNLSEVRTA